ncbi:MAG: dienelactone hydrolase family protein [Betaproteobacteria bacterium]|nr:dienelactone hydrolase family protein [Betaproteobacteria bacterium]
MGAAIELTSPDGFRPMAYRADPPGTPRGGLVVVQEIFGVNAHIRSVCDGYAADGYVAVAPALFDRYQRDVDWGYTPEDITRGRDVRARADAAAALMDIVAARAVAARAGRVGIVGYCWGGFIAWLAAARVDGLACAIAYYGGGMPDAIGEKPRCPVLAHFGEQDAMIPVAGVQALAAAHPTMQVHLYAAGHGFNCDQRGSYDAAAAATARARTLAFLRQYVG